MNIDINKVPEYYRPYVSQLGDADLVPLLLKSGDHLVSTCKNLTETQSLYRYEDGKWNIKDLVQHLIDSERVFAYRAMRFSRNDKTVLSGFEQDDYVAEAGADSRPLRQLLMNFTNLRTTTIDLFSSFSMDQMNRKGVSNGKEMSVEMIGYIISGHTLHHLGIIKKRYLK